MRKFTRVLSAIIFIFIGAAGAAAQGAIQAGANTLPEVTATTSYRFNSIQPIDTEEGRKMVKHYSKKDARKDKGGFLKLDPEDLVFLSTQTGVKRVFIVQAAYLQNHADVSKRNRPVTLIVVERNMGGRQFDYYESLSLCPPPEGTCDLETIED